ncbi:MAG: hypothetical protein IJ683_06865 [Butyrivibrio sp.]|nr:hypothetical protein [Butyrivibrio sp.]MBR1642024.1 hypothetical protein [Butyrivibrio sp.]
MYRKPLQTTTYGIAVFNLFAAFIYSIALVDKLHIEGKIRVPVQIAFIVVFAVLEFIPKVVLLPAGAAGFMNGFTAWSLLAGIGNPVIKMILRIVAIIIIALIELSLFTDVTLGNKEDTRIPSIQQVRAQGYRKKTVDGVTRYTKE